MKPLLTILFACILLFPGTSQAQSTQYTTEIEIRIALIEKIIFLIEQIKQLQAILLAQQELEQSASTYTPQTSYTTTGPWLSKISASSPTYQTELYRGQYESIYTTKTTVTTASIPNNDEQIWQLLIDVVGAPTARTYINEFRIYSDSNAEFDAFIELKRLEVGTGDWIFGINDADFDLDNASSRQNLRDLFIHEYAHLLIHYRPAVETLFTNKFWTTDDYEHKRDVSSASLSKRDDLIENYYSKNDQDFISSYATISPEEDFSESFLHFVLLEKPTGVSTSDKKINFLYDYADLVTIRTQIRDRLNL